VEYSPFFEHRLACASAANFGIVGNGRLWIFNTAAPPGTANPDAAVERTYDTQDGLFDIAWSEVHENQLVTSSGDGSIKLWDLSLADFPIRNWSEHAREVFSVNWNLVSKDTFLSASWDHSIKLWSPESETSLSTWQDHTHCVYQATWSPTSATAFASASGDGTVRTWDARAPRASTVLRAHDGEVLALDWNKYDPAVLVSGSVDRSVRAWDLRRPDRPLAIVGTHGYAVRRLRCSPHSRAVVASVGYDMTARFWDLDAAAAAAAGPPPPPLHVHDLHTEFVLGVDLNMFVPGR
ncbi:peroxisomal targeting signal 2 receptor, partial [Cladochytrium tenue]